MAKAKKTTNASKKSGAKTVSMKKKGKSAETLGKLAAEMKGSMKGVKRPKSLGKAMPLPPSAKARKSAKKK